MKTNHKIIILLTLCLMLSACAHYESDASIFDEDDCFLYRYSLLDEDEQDIYESLYAAMQDQTSFVMLDSHNGTDIASAYTALMGDHPEFFYVEKISIYGWGIFGFVRIHYNEENIAQIETVDALIESIVSGISASASDYQKIKYVYDYVIEHTEYNEDANNNQNVLSVLLEGESVCAGYAKTVQWLLNEMGIPCAYITGEAYHEDADSASHAWNMVYTNGGYYYLDSTWGDSEATGGDLENPFHTCYAYFLMSEEETENFYEPDQAIQESASTYNFYTVNNMVVSEYNAYTVMNIMRTQVNWGWDVLEIKCTEDSFDEVYDKLFNQSAIFNLLSNIGIYTSNLYYKTIDGLYMIEIYLGS